MSETTGATPNFEGKLFDVVNTMRMPLPLDSGKILAAADTKGARDWVKLTASDHQRLVVPGTVVILGVKDDDAMQAAAPDTTLAGQSSTPESDIDRQHVGGKKGGK